MNVWLGIVGGWTGLATYAWIRTRIKLQHTYERFRHEMADLRAQREIELCAQTARTAALFDHMIEGVMVIGPKGTIRLANAAAGSLFGFAAPGTDLTVLEATRHHEVAALVGRLEAESEVLNHELRLERVAATRYLQVNAVALRLPDGGRDGAVLVFHEFTRMRQLESVRQDFVANVSHELRTPLSLIKSAAETLIDGGKNDPKVSTRFLDIIDRNANRLTLLIDDLLLLARLDSGRIELELQPVSVRELVQDAIGDAAIPAARRQITLANEVPADLVTHADPHRLRQVLSNLIDNAIKYGRGEGHVAVAGRTIADRAVEISVADDGPGIPLDAQDRIFERFYRIDKARSREQGGTGLGLAIVKNVVQAHGGEVRVESTPGDGAKFILTFPVGTPRARLAPAA